MAENNTMQEWSIKEVAKATGLTSRTLRHYEQIGLLHPSRVASSGYRFYSETELSRLYKILSLRALELPLAAIQKTLDDDESLAETIQAHLTLLEERRDRTNQQIAVVRQTLHAVQEGQEMSIEEVFAGFDQSQYESEVRERWGDAAWENSAKRRNDMTEEERKADDERSLDVNAALRKAAESGVDPESAEFQAIVGEHHKWVTDHWNGRTPDKNSYTGLSQLYVSDARFAATYGGQANAEIIRNAIQLWAEANLR
ncbi:MerR family transcriptional regulator [Pseudarthrobacter sp. J1738]|uniref:MerR family transcriptional regulator n=1 Tax=unclassified Pseudarthrobacter TaxID=2647000 RepID=UPI003D27FD9C